MVSGTRRQVRIGNAALEIILQQAHDVAPAGLGALRARIRHLQRMDFPRKLMGGRGIRVEYDVNDALKLMMVFELFEMGMAPQFATAMVEQAWPLISRTLASAWSTVRHRDHGRDQPPRELRTIIAFQPGALRELATSPESHAAPRPDVVVPMTPDEVKAWMVEGDPAGPRRLTIIEPVRLMFMFMSILEIECRYRVDEVDEALIRFGQKAAGLGASDETAAAE